MDNVTDMEFCACLCSAAKAMTMPMTRHTTDEGVQYGFVEPLSGQRINGERSKDRVNSLVSACKALQKYLATK